MILEAPSASAPARADSAAVRPGEFALRRFRGVIAHQQGIVVRGVTRVHLEAENEARTKKYYKFVFSEYRRGVKNSADVKSAASGLFETSLRKEQFKFEFLSRRLELERALGGPVEYQVASEFVPHK